MFICAELLQDVKVGELIVVKYDEYSKTLGAHLITGEKVGEISSQQAEGCLDFWTIASRIEDNRIICHVVIKGGRLLILSTESKILSGEYSRPAPCIKQEVPAHVQARARYTTCVGYKI
ncbi:MAG: hypothetical protein J6C23_05365 [Clostridia bacterium]|nr:hypothetical protein [Clostridia bacterium]